MLGILPRWVVGSSSALQPSGLLVLLPYFIRLTTLRRVSQPHCSRPQSLSMPKSMPTAMLAVSSAVHACAVLAILTVSAVMSMPALHVQVMSMLALPNAPNVRTYSPSALAYYPQPRPLSYSSAADALSGRPAIMECCPHLC